MVPLDADTSVSVVEMTDFEFDISCAGRYHGKKPFHGRSDEPATHYVRFRCPSCDFSHIKPYCMRYVKIMCVTDEYTMRCKNCDTGGLVSAEVLTIMGSVKI